MTGEEQNPPLDPSGLLPPVDPDLVQVTPHEREKTTLNIFLFRERMEEIEA